MRFVSILLALFGLAVGQAAAQPPEPPVPFPLAAEKTAPVFATEPPTPLSGRPAARDSEKDNARPSTPTMTLAELEGMALKNNPTLAQAEARVEAARGQHLQVGLYPNPVAGYIGAEMGNDGRAGQQGGFIGQEVVTAGKLRLNRAVASQDVRQAEHALEAQQTRIVTDVRRGFYEVLAAQRSMELSEQLVGLGEQGVKTAEALAKAKEVARADILQARIEADSARIQLEKARNRHTGTWRNLAAVVGDPALPVAPLAGGLGDGIPQFTWEDSLNRLQTESPELAAAEAGVARANAALSRECAGRVPNVDLQAAVQYDNATRDTFATLQVGVPIPIYNRNQGNIYRAQSELTAARQEVQRVRLALHQRLAAVFEQYATANQQVQKYQRDMLPNAKESLNLVSSGYRQGEFSYLAYLTAQRTYFQTNLAYLDALRDLRAASAAIEGNLLSDSLQNSAPLPSGGK